MKVTLGFFINVFSHFSSLPTKMPRLVVFFSGTLTITFEKLNGKS